MRPDRHDGMTDGALGLRDLVLVVGELVVVTTGVYVEAIAQVFDRHRGALDMPSRISVAPRTRPSQETVRAGFFHSAKSSGCRLPGSAASSVRCPARNWSSVFPESFP